jgi:hypothetical protein
MKFYVTKQMHKFRRTACCLLIAAVFSGASFAKGKCTFSHYANKVFVSRDNTDLFFPGKRLRTLINPANVLKSPKALSSSSFMMAAATATDFWVEDFTLANGTISDSGTTSWSATTTGSGTFSVQNNEFMASFNSGNTAEGVWSSGIIDITSKSNVVVSIDLRSATASTSDFLETSDYINVYYKLNGGSETLLYGDVAGLNGTTTGTATYTATSPALNGGSLQIVVRVKNSDPTERYYFDNIKVSGTTVTQPLNISAAVSGVLTCNNSSVTLVGNSTAPGVTYKWTGPNNFTSTAKTVSVGTEGSYVLTVTNSAGVSSSAVAVVSTNYTAPGATAAVTSQLSCTSATATLSGSSATSGVTYSWTGPDGFTSSVQNPTVSTLGTYTLTVTNPVNGCSSSSPASVTAAGSGPVGTIWLEDFTLANGTTKDTGTSSWSSSTTGAGTFSVQNNEFKASFNSGNTAEGVWTSGPIDISTKTNVVVSVDLRSGTASSSDFLETSDYINVYYKIDGGAEQLIYGDVAGLNGTTTGTASYTVTSSALTGGSLQIVIRVKNSDPTERYYFDNVKVTGQSQAVGAITTSASGIVTCPSPNVQLTASVAGTSPTYYWITPGNSTIQQQNPTVNVPGTYTVVATVGGCVASKMVTVGGSTTIPDVKISGDHLATNIASPITLTAISSNANLNYAWSGLSGAFTSTLKAPTVSTPGTYTVTVTDKTTSCANSASFVVKTGALIYNEDFEGLAPGLTVDSGATAWSIDNTNIHTVDLSAYSSETGLPYYFQTDTNRLAAKSTLGEVIWTSQSINISGVTQLYARVKLSGKGSLNDSTDCGRNCFDYDYVKVYYKLNGGAETLFSNLGSVAGKVALSSPVISSDIPSGNTMQIIIKAYNTGNNEIYYFDDIQLMSLNQAPQVFTATASGSLTCVNNSVTLTASPVLAGATYSWSGPGGFTASGSSTNVSAPGTYTLNVLYNGVAASPATVTIAQNITMPDAIAIGGKLTCTKTSVILSGSSSASGVTYSWSGPSSSTLQNPSVTLPGTYTLVVTNPTNGCTSSDTAIVSQNITAPSATGTGGKLTCTKTSVTLTGSSSTSGVTYSWSGPSSSTAQNPTVTAPGTYTLVVTNPTNGCTSSDTAMVSQNITAPGATGIGGKLTCTKTSVTLTGSSPTSGVTYSWSGPSSSTAQNPSVTLPGTYTLVVTNPTNGCTSSDTAMVGQNITVPGATGIGGKLTCTKTSVTLTGSSSTNGVTYSWSGPSSSIAQNPTVTLPGTYTLVVTNPTNGCTSSDTAMVSQNIAAPGANANGGIITCRSGSTTLNGSSSTSGVNYSWSGPSSSTLQNPLVSVSGIYTLVVTNPVNGCTSTDTALVKSDKTLPGATAGISGNSVLTCSFKTAYLLGSSSTAGVTYSWGSSLGYSSTEQNPVTNVAGKYILTVLNPVNGCTSKDSVVVTQDTTKARGITASAGKITCTVAQATITGNSTTNGASYRWEGPGGFTYSGSTTSVIVPGDYKLYITNPANGCDTLIFVKVALDTIKPKITILSSGILSCTANSVSLTASSATTGLSYSWSGPGFTATGAHVDVTEAGDYLVTVTNPSNNCTSITKASVVKDITHPTVNTSVVGTLSCATPTVQLSVLTSADSATYSWTGPLGYVSNEPSPVVNTSGPYVVTVTNKYNNCSTDKQLQVQNPDTTKPAPVQLTVGGVINCKTHSIVIFGYSATTGVSYSWEGPGGFKSALQNPAVQDSGIYTLTVTAPNGCKVSGSDRVAKDITAPSGVTAKVSGPINCNNWLVDLIGSPSGSNLGYLWSGPEVFNETEITAFTSTAGEYKLVVTNTHNYCSDSATVVVVEDKALPVANIITPSSSPVALTNNNVLSAEAVTNASYLWTISSTNQNWRIVSDSVSQSITYKAGDVATSATVALTVTGTNGCSSANELQLTSVSQKAALLLAGADSVEREFTVNIYPNPLSGPATLEFAPNQSGHAVIGLYTGNGNFVQELLNEDVQEGNLHKLTIDGNSLTSGTYLCRIKISHSIYTYKIQVVK